MKKNKNKNINQLEAEILKSKSTDTTEHSKIYNIFKKIMLVIYIIICTVCKIIEWLFFILCGIIIIFTLKRRKKG